MYTHRDYEAGIDETVCAAQVRAELARHGVEWCEFTSECGEHDSYSAIAVLAWLGY